MLALDGRLLDRPVHPFDLTVRPWVPRLGKAVLDIEIGAGAFEGVAEERQLKDFRRVATRYDKLAANFLSGVALATALAFWL